MRNDTKCLFVGHNLRVLNDKKSIWCDRCEKRLTVVKKGYGEDGINMVKRHNPSVIYVILKLAGITILGIWVVVYLK